MDEKVKNAVRALAGAVRRKDSVVTLVMVVDYDSTPDTGELEGLIDKAREYGGVEVVSARASPRKFGLMSRQFITLGAVEYTVDIESDGEYFGDPLKIVGTNTLLISDDAHCVKCGEADWDVEFRGYMGENPFAVCVCGTAYPIQFQKDGK